MVVAREDQENDCGNRNSKLVGWLQPCGHNKAHMKIHGHTKAHWHVILSRTLSQVLCACVFSYVSLSLSLSHTHTHTNALVRHTPSHSFSSALYACLCICLSPPLSLPDCLPLSPPCLHTYTALSLALIGGIFVFASR